MNIILGYITVAIGTLCILLPLIAIIRRADSQTWRLIQAKVIQSDVDAAEWRGKHSHESYSHRLSVQYEVEGVKYTYEPSLKIAYGKEEKVRELCKKFPVGTAMWIRVHWKNPKRIVIEGYETLWTYVPVMLIGIVFLLVGLFWVGWLDWNFVKRLFSSLFNIHQPKSMNNT